MMFQTAAERWTARTLLCALVALLMLANVSVAQQNDNRPMAPAPRYWTTRWNFQSVDVHKLARRLNSIGIELGLDLQGDVTIALTVGVPLTSLRDGAAYRLDGTLSSSKLVVDQVQLENFQATVQYRDGNATLNELRATVAAPDGRSGRVRGQAELQLVPRGDLQARLDVQDLALGPLLTVAQRFASSPQLSMIRDGTVTGRLDYQAPLDSITDVATYELEGKLTADGLQLSGLPPATLVIPEVTIQRGRLQAKAVELRTQPIASSDSELHALASVSVPLRGTGEFTAELAADDMPVRTALELLARDSYLARASSGKLDLKMSSRGTLAATLADTNWSVDAAIASPALTVAGLELGRIEHDIRMTATELAVSPRRPVDELPELFRIGKLTSRYTVTDQALALDQFEATMFGGSVQGTATLPLATAGNLIANLQLMQLRPTLQMPVSELIRPKIAATIDGNLQWSVPVDSIDRPSTHQGRGQLTVSQIRMGDETVGQLRAEVTADRGELSLAAQGELFGGTVQIDTLASVQANDGWSDVRQRLTTATFRLGDVELESLLDLVQEDSKYPLTGRVSAVVTASDSRVDPLPRRDAESLQAIIRLADLRHGRVLLARQVRAEGRFSPGVVRIDSVVGDYAGGVVRAAGRMDIGSGEPGTLIRPMIQVSISRVDVGRGLWFLGSVASELAGRASGSFVIAGQQANVRFRGNLNARDLVVAGVSLDEAHSSVAGGVDLRSGRWRVRFPNIESRAGGGRVSGSVKLASGSHGGRAADLDSRWQTNRVDVFQLSERLQASSAFAHGEISGKLAVAGRSVRSVDDLTGEFQLQLGDTRGAALPGVAGVSRFLGPVSLATERFDTGAARGTIGGGALLFNELWLGSDAALIRAQGKVFLRSQKMDLEAIIATGDFTDIAGDFAELAREYALRSLLPASAILSVTELLRDRAIVVRLQGTVNRPIVRLLPVETFREEAVRFLLREGQRLILAGATAGALDLGN